MTPKNVIAAARQDIQAEIKYENIHSDNGSSQDLSGFEHQHHNHHRQ